MDKYCRFCAEEAKNLSELSQIKNDILSWLMLIVNIDKDELPQNICYTCLCNIEELEYFIEKCKQSYTYLKSLSVNVDTEETLKYEYKCDDTSKTYSDEYLEEETLSESNYPNDNSSMYEVEENKATDLENSNEPIDGNLSIMKIEAIETDSNEEICKKFECEYCHVTFKSRNEKSEHIKEHNFFCTECGKNFPTKSKFNYHLANHKNKREHACTYCNKAFNHRSDLTNHLRFSHSVGTERRRKYRCELCDKNYCTPNELKIHIRFHKNERPYKCHLCDHAYVIKCHLQQHLKRHADIKDKVCTEPGCGKAYRDMSSLKKHMDIHLPDDTKKYSCDVCSKKFSFFYILSDHRRKSHSKIASLQPLKKDEIQI